MATEPAKEYPLDIVRGTFFEHDIPINDIRIHVRTMPDGYARPLRTTRINYLIANFDRQALGVLLLSMRADGSFWCIDGQHRIDVCKHFGIETMDAFVYIDLTLEDEARLYRKFGDYLKQTALDRFHAGVIERVPEYLAIQRIVGEVGLRVPSQSTGSQHTIDAVDALIRVSTVYGLKVLKQTLEFLNDAWNGDHKAFRGMCLNGTAAFLVRFQDNALYSHRRLMRRLKKVGVSAVERRGMTIKEANLASNPNASWGMALVAEHDYNMPEDERLGEWPRRHISEQAAENARKNLQKVNASLTAAQKSARSAKGHQTLGPAGQTAKAIKAAVTRRGYSPRAIPCSYCNAEPGKPCRTANGNWLPGNHRERKEQAQLLAQKAQVNGK